MSADLKFVRHSSFPWANTEHLASGWFWKLKIREWAIGQLDVTDTTIFPVACTGATNNPDVIRILSSTRSPDGKTITLKFYARTQGTAYLYLRDSTGADPFAAMDGKLMQVVVTERRSRTEAAASLTKLEGTTFATNAPDTPCYTMGTNQIFEGSDAKTLFDAVPGSANHVVVASHGIMVGPEHNMFVGGSTHDERRISNANVEKVFANLKGKVDEKCVVWLGCCGIGSNQVLCSRASLASGCPVVACGHALLNKGIKAGFVDCLDKVGMCMVYLPTVTDGKPRFLGDFCINQEDRKFFLPI